MRYNIYAYTFCFFILCIFLYGCTVYTEKQSKALSQTVYATKDSLDVARIDLADSYINEAVKIVKPPKQRINIQPIYKQVKPNIDTISSDSKYNKLPVSKQRMVIIPEKYKQDTVVVVSSKEFEDLLKDKDVIKQLQKDSINLQDAKKLVDDELIRQMEYQDKMIKDLNIMQKKLVEKDLAILQRNIVIVILSSLIGLGVYLRFKGGLLF